MKHLFVSLFVVATLLSHAAVAHAEDDIWTKANSPIYKEKAPAMFGRGLLNAGSCFVDLAVQTVEKSKSGPPIAGTLTGIASGATCTVLRAASGVIDVASFWIPGFNGIPVSRSYSDCLAIDTVVVPVAEPAPAPVYVQPAPQPVVVQEAPAPQDAPREYDPNLSIKK